MSRSDLLSGAVACLIVIDMLAVVGALYVLFLTVLDWWFGDAD